MDLTIKRCSKCGAMVQVMKDCTCDNCGIKCCGEQMQTLVPNTVDCAVEKHKPVVKKVDNQVLVTVNHVMENDHYIEWIAMVSDEKMGKKILKPNQEAIVTFPYIKGSKIYAYCNKHGLWETDVD